jgi:hypothetical protein
MVQHLLANRYQTYFVLIVGYLFLPTYSLARPLSLDNLVLSLEIGYLAEEPFAELALCGQSFLKAWRAALQGDFELEFVGKVVDGDAVVVVDGVPSDEDLHLVLVGVIANVLVNNILTQGLDMI